MHLPERSGSRQEYYKLTYLRGDLTQELVRYLEMLCMGESYANHYRFALWEYINLLEQLGEAIANLEFWSCFEKFDVDYILKMAKLKRDHKNLTSHGDLHEGGTIFTQKKEMADSIRLSPHEATRPSRGFIQESQESEIKDSSLDSHNRANMGRNPSQEPKKPHLRPHLKLRTKRLDDEVDRGSVGLDDKRSLKIEEPRSEDELSQIHDDPTHKDRGKRAAGHKNPLKVDPSVQFSPKASKPYGLDSASQKILQRSKAAIPEVNLGKDMSGLRFGQDRSQMSETPMNPKAAALNKALAFSSAEFDQLVQGQLETIKKQNELTDELYRRLIQQHAVIKSDEGRFRTQYLMFAKKVSMLLGFHAAEVFFKKELHTNLAVFFRKTDLDQTYSWLN